MGEGKLSLMDQVKQNYSGAKSIDLTFDLTIDWKVREIKESQTGRIVIASGDRFRAETGETIYVCDGQTFWQYSKKSRQVVIKRFLDIDFAQQPSQVLTGYIRNHTYTLKLEDNVESMYEWKADSIGATPSIVFISLWIDRAQAVVKRIFLRDRSGNESTYSIKKTTIGATPVASVFKFDPPNGARVIDARD